MCIASPNNSSCRLCAPFGPLDLTIMIVEYYTSCENPEKDCHFLGASHLVSHSHFMRLGSIFQPTLTVLFVFLCISFCFLLVVHLHFMICLPALCSQRSVFAINFNCLSSIFTLRHSLCYFVGGSWGAGGSVAVAPTFGLGTFVVSRLLRIFLLVILLTMAPNLPLKTT